MKFIYLFSIIIFIAISIEQKVNIIYKDIPKPLQIQQGAQKKILIKNYVQSLPIAITSLPFNDENSQEMGLINIILTSTVKIPEQKTDSKNNSETLNTVIVPESKITLDQKTDGKNISDTIKNAEIPEPIKIQDSKTVSNNTSETINIISDIQNEQTQSDPNSQNTQSLSNSQTVQDDSMLISSNDSNNNLQQNQNSEISTRLRQLIQQSYDHYQCQMSAVYKTCIIPENKLDNSFTQLQFNITCLRGPCNFKIYATQQVVSELQSLSPTQLKFDQKFIQIIKLPKLNFMERFILDIEFDKKDTNVNRSQIHFPNGAKTISIDGDRLIAQFTFNQQKNITRQCSDCLMQGVVISDPGTFANIFLYRYGQKVQIFPSIQYLDRGQSNQFNKYLIKLEEEYQYDYLEFTAMFLSTQQSNLVLYIHGDKIPESEQSYYWIAQFSNSLFNDGESANLEDNQRNKKYKLVITKSQLIDLEMTGEEFYLSIFSEVSASYSFQYKVEMNSVRPMHLDINEISCGKIEKFQVQPYLFETDKNQNLIISLKLMIKQGDAKIYVKQYQSLQDFKQTNLLEIKSNNVGKFIGFGNQKKKEITLQANCPDLVCKFIIYIVGTSINSTKYKLEASYIQDNKVQLGENVAYSGLLRWGSQKYFVHYLQKPEDIIMLSVQISCQEIDIFVSLSDDCQNPNNECEKVIKGGSQKPVILNQKQLKSKSAVYIGIQAIRHCEYSLAVKIKRANSSSVVQIHEGKPYVSQLNQQNPFNYFQFSANLGSNEGLEVNIWAPFGKVIILATNDGSYPDLQNKQYQWISRNNFLDLNIKDKKFKTDGNYIFSVILSENAIQSTDLSFKIMISSSASIKVIDLNEPFFDTILPFGSKAYEIHVNPTEQMVILNRNIISSDEIAKDLTFYIGDDVYEDIKDYQFQLTGGEKATFQLISQNLDKLCLLDNEFCSIYILVKNYGSGQAQYTLTVLENSLAVPLLEGYQHTYTLYYVNEYMNFYYVPTHQDTSVNFYLYSFYGRTNFSVKVWKQDSQLTQPVNWPFPTDKIPAQETNYTSAIHNSHSISISPSSFSQCWPSCKVLISVSFLEENEYNSTQAQLFDDQFTLIASTIYNNIQDDDRVQFTLQEQESKYFFYDIRNILIQNMKGNSILCQLTPLSGRGIMTASIKDDQQNRMPMHLVSSDFISYSNHLEISLTTIKKIMKKQKLSNSSNPTIVFEISAYGSAGKFIFSIYNSQNDVRDILNGVPFDFNVNQNQEVVFQFFNYFKSDLQIRISREIGFGDLQLYSCENIIVQQCIDQQEPDKSIRMVGSSDSDAVWLQEGRSLIDSLGKDELNLYRLSIPSNEELELSLIQYTGAVSVYINYYYETDYKKFRDGPFFSNLQSLNKFFQIRIPARDTLMLDDKSKIQNDDLATEFIENEIYVLVRNTGSSSNYSISYSSGELEKFIIDGQMIFQQLESQQTLKLIYSYFDRDAPAILSISILNPQDVSIDLIKIDAWVIPQQSFYDVTDGNYMKNFSLEVKSKRDNTITMNLPQITGSYEIEFTNNNKKSANFSTYINTRDMTLMPFNTRIQHLLPDNSVNYYEFLIPRKGYLGLEMIHCVGDLLIGYSQNYDSFLKHEFTKSSTSQQGHTYIDPIQVKQGPIYFALITQDQEAFYTISGNWYKSIKEIPQIKLRAGNDGLVSWTRDRGNNAFFEFYPLKCVDCNSKEKNDPKVVYEIFISKDEEILNVIGKCDAKQYFDHDAIEMDDYLQRSKFKPSDFINGISSKAFPMNLDSQFRLNYSMKLNEYQTIYYGGIKATIKNFPGINGDIVVFYENLMMAPNNYIGEDPLEFMVIALAAFLLVLIICLFIGLIGRRVYKNTLDRVIQDSIQDFSGPKQYKTQNKSQNINEEESQSQIELGNTSLKTAQELAFTTNKGYASLEDEM